MEEPQYAQDGSLIVKDYMPGYACDELLEILYTGSHMGWACIGSIFARINHCDCYLHRGIND